MAFLVVDSPFNRANYPNLIGKVYEVAPSYAQVKLVGVLEESVRETTNLSSSRYIVAKIDSWAPATKQEYIRAYEEGDWDKVYFLTPDLTGSAHSQQNTLRGLYDVLEEQMASPRSQTQTPAEQNVGTQILKTLVEHTIDDITYEQMNRIVRRLNRMSRQDRGAPKRVAEVLYDELGPEKSIQYVEKAFANGMIQANEYYALRGFLTFPMKRTEIPVPWAGKGSQELIAGQKRLQQDLAKVRELGVKTLAKPMEALNKDVERLRRAWGL